MKAFILAAGLGTRLRPLTNDRPKVMVAIGGKPVLEHLINLCHKHNLVEIIVNLHYLPQVIKNYFGDGQKWGVHITYSDETKMIMGGAGALKQAENLLEGQPTLVLNGDVMTNINLTNMMAYHRQKGGWATLATHPSDHPKDSDRIIFNESGKVSRIYRSGADSKEVMTNSGIHLFEAGVLALIPKDIPFSIEKELIPKMLWEAKPVFAYPTDEYAKDMGTLDRLTQVEYDYTQGKINL
jgi:NDP-sugar pyrophosphorylase family protein